MDVTVVTYVTFVSNYRSRYFPPSKCKSSERVHEFHSNYTSTAGAKVKSGKEFDLENAGGGG
jgi:hypothetical protein